MSKSPRRTIEVQGASVTVLSQDREDIFCLTDIAKFKNPDHPDDVIRNWLRTRSTVEFLGVWERLNNPDFNPVEFDGIRMQTGLNSFVLTPKQWIEKTGAVGLTSSAGRYGGTYAHKDIAFEFASWVSVEFKLYLIKEFQRLKDDENDRLQLNWNLQRTLAKINYRIHTDAIKETLLPPTITKAQTAFVYASEADLLNVALFVQNYRLYLPDREELQVPHRPPLRGRTHRRTRTRTACHRTATERRRIMSFSKFSLPRCDRFTAKPGLFPSQVIGESMNRCISNSWATPRRSIDSPPSGMVAIQGEPNSEYPMVEMRHLTLSDALEEFRAVEKALATNDT